MRLVRYFLQSDLMNKYQAKGVEIADWEGICLRLSFKFAALNIAGEEFKYNNLNLEKALDKQRAYGVDTDNRSKALTTELGDLCDFTLDETTEADYALVQATSRDHLSAWASAYTYKKGEERTEYSLSVGEPFDGSLESYLENHSIKEGEAVLISYYGRSPNKQSGNGHTMALIGGSPPYFFDPNQGVFELESNNVGREVGDYIAREYKMAEDFEIVPLSNARKKTRTSADDIEETTADVPQDDKKMIQGELQNRGLDYAGCTKTGAGPNRTYAGSPIGHNTTTNDLYLIRQHAPDATRDIVCITAEQHGLSMNAVQQRVKTAAKRREQGVADIIAVHTRPKVKVEQKETKKKGRKK